MQIIRSFHADHVRFALNGELTFADHRDFRAVLDAIDPVYGTHIHIDLAQIEFIDSAGLGMLLLARDKASVQGIRMTLANPSGQVRRMFELSQFYQLFTVTHERR